MGGGGGSEAPGATATDFGRLMRASRRSGSVHIVNMTLALVGMLILMLGLFSGPIRGRLWVSEPLIALGVGFLLGPAFWSGVLPREWATPEVIEQVARITLSIGLMGVALRLPAHYMRRHWRPITVMLVVVMPFMWLSSGLLTAWILGLPIWLALLIGAIAAPTDPVVASSIVSGRAAKRIIPERVRHLLSGESGANDGLGLPFVMLCILMLTRPSGEGISHWLMQTLLYEVGMGLLLGGMLGYAGGWLFKWSEERDYIEEVSFLGYTLALTLAVLGLCKLAGTDAIFAVFVSGLTFSWVVGDSERHEEENVQEAISQFFTLPIFVLIGLIAPWQAWLALGWKGLLLAIAVLLLRRLPIVLLTWRFIGPLKSWPDALYAGWFGPIGVAALLYAHMAVSQTQYHQAWVIGSLLICASLVAHGITATPLMRLYERHHPD
jgi:NhaP-type Na+/H+ or K+/H+ antiporter